VAHQLACVFDSIRKELFAGIVESTDEDGGLVGFNSRSWAGSLTF
jgi:hypothetical protein